jgi:hypothetical protein
MWSSLGRYALDTGAAFLFFLRDGTEATFFFQILSRGIKNSKETVALRAGAVVGFCFVVFAFFGSHLWFAGWVAHLLEPVSWMVPTIIAGFILFFGVTHFREDHRHDGRVRRLLKTRLVALPATLLFASMAWVISFEGLEFNANALTLRTWPAFTGLLLGVAMVLTVLPLLIRWAAKRFGMAITMFWQNVALMFLGPVVLLKGFHEFDVHHLLPLGAVLIGIDLLATAALVQLNRQQLVRKLHSVGTSPESKVA